MSSKLFERLYIIFIRFTPQGIFSQGTLPGSGQDNILINRKSFKDWVGLWLSMSFKTSQTKLLKKAEESFICFQRLNLFDKNTVKIKSCFLL